MHFVCVFVCVSVCVCVCVCVCTIKEQVVFKRLHMMSTLTFKSLFE